MKALQPSRNEVPAFLEKIADVCVQADVNIERITSWRAYAPPDHLVAVSPKLPKKSHSSQSAKDFVRQWMLVDAWKRNKLH